MFTFLSYWVLEASLQQEISAYTIKGSGGSGLSRSL